jgi:hypothetical protein
MRFQYSTYALVQPLDNRAALLPIFVHLTERTELGQSAVQIVYQFYKSLRSTAAKLHCALLNLERDKGQVALPYTVGLRESNHNYSRNIISMDELSEKKKFQGVLYYLSLQLRNIS